MRAPESNPATSATKRSCGKSPSSKDKPKKIRHKRGNAEKPKIGSPKPPAVVQSGSGAFPATSSNIPATTFTGTPSLLKHYRRKTSAGRVQIPESRKRYPYRAFIFLHVFYLIFFCFVFLIFFFFILGANHIFSWLQQSGGSEGTQSEEYNFEDTTTNSGKLLFLTSVSSHISSSDVLYSLGPTNEDIEMAGKSPDVAVTAGGTATQMLGQEYANKDLEVTISIGKGPNVTVSTGKAVASVPNQGHIVSLTVHDVHHIKEPLGMMTSSRLYSTKQVFCSIILGCMSVLCYCWRYNHASFCRVTE